ncbi:hypothetical protein [Dysgonomonas reticulitermitis]
MKKFIVAFALLIGIASFNNPVEAQNISININIGRQPAWGPVGYDYVNYYYLPDIDCYYDVNMSLFYYFDRGHWISARYLPYAYRHYDLYGMYKVVLNMNDPWRYHHSHYRDYARYRGYRNQVVIRDSRDNRYHDSRRNKVVWFSKSKSQRDYRYDYKNYNYDRRDNQYKGNSVRPNRDYNYGNNNPDRNKGNDKKYDNNRKDNNRPDYGNNNSRPDRSKEGSRPSVRSNNKDTKSTRSSSNSSYRLASSERNRR